MQSESLEGSQCPSAPPLEDVAVDVSKSDVTSVNSERSIAGGTLDSQRPPCCCGMFKGRWGFWVPTIWSSPPCLSALCCMCCWTCPCRHLATDASDIEEYGCRWKAVVGFVFFPFVFLVGLFAGMFGFLIDVVGVIIFLVSCCGCFCKKSACKAHGELCIWAAQMPYFGRGLQAKGPTYDKANGTNGEAATFSFGSSSGPRRYR